MTARIRAALPGSDGAIASALITGERGGIDQADQTALRDAGLAHVLAIAGLHMALVGLGLFWLVRAVLAAFPRVALNYPIKKWAAGAALLGGLLSHQQRSPALG
jgi:competence protein ComEC